MLFKVYLIPSTPVVPQLKEAQSVENLLRDSFPTVSDPASMALLMIDRLGQVGCKTALRLAERSVASSSGDTDQVRSLESILDDLAGDEINMSRLCRLR